MGWRAYHHVFVCSFDCDSHCERRGKKGERRGSLKGKLEGERRGSLKGKLEGKKPAEGLLQSTTGCVAVHCTAVGSCCGPSPAASNLRLVGISLRIHALAVRTRPKAPSVSAARLLAAGHSGRLDYHWVAPLLSLVPCPAAACARASRRSPAPGTNRPLSQQEGLAGAVPARGDAGDHAGARRLSASLPFLLRSVPLPLPLLSCLLCHSRWRQMPA
jgi:hypothetical protein